MFVEHFVLHLGLLGLLTKFTALSPKICSKESPMSNGRLYAQKSGSDVRSGRRAHSLDVMEDMFSQEH